MLDVASRQCIHVHGISEPRHVAHTGQTKVERQKTQESNSGRGWRLRKLNPYPVLRHHDGTIQFASMSPRMHHAMHTDAVLTQSNGLHLALCTGPRGHRASSLAFG